MTTKVCLGLWGDYVKTGTNIDTKRTPCTFLLISLMCVLLEIPEGVQNTGKIRNWKPIVPGPRNPERDRCVSEDANKHNLLHRKSYYDVTLPSQAGSSEQMITRRGYRNA